MAEFLNKDGLQYLVERLVARLVELIEQKNQINIIAAIDENSTNQEIPGAKAVYDLLTDALAGLVHLRARVVDTLPSAGEANIIYLVKVANTANTYTQHMYIDNNWIDLGPTTIDLTNYWAKDDLVALTNTEIQAVIDDVMGV